MIRIGRAPWVAQSSPADQSMGAARHLISAVRMTQDATSAIPKIRLTPPDRDRYWSVGWGFNQEVGRGRNNDHDPDHDDLAKHERWPTN